MTIDIYPKTNKFNAVTKGFKTIITLVDTVNYVENQLVTIQCPSAYGMAEIDGLTARITSVNTGANTITVDIDSTNFSTFTGGTHTQIAMVIPAGEFNTTEAAYKNNLSRSGYTVV